MRGDADEIAPVVDALDADAGRQNAASVDFVDFGLDPFDGGYALGAAAHEYDALDDVVHVVVTGDAAGTGVRKHLIVHLALVAGLG